MSGHFLSAGEVRKRKGGHRHVEAHPPTVPPPSPPPSPPVEIEAEAESSASSSSELSELELSELELSGPELSGPELSELEPFDPQLYEPGSATRNRLQGRSTPTRTHRSPPSPGLRTSQKKSSRPPFASQPYSILKRQSRQSSQSKTKNSSSRQSRSTANADSRSILTSYPASSLNPEFPPASTDYARPVVAKRARLPRGTKSPVSWARQPSELTIQRSPTSASIVDDDDSDDDSEALEGQSYVDTIIWCTAHLRRHHKRFIMTLTAVLAFVFIPGLPYAISRQLIHLGLALSSCLRWIKATTFNGSLWPITTPFDNCTSNPPKAYSPIWSCDGSGPLHYDWSLDYLHGISGLDVIASEMYEEVKGEGEHLGLVEEIDLLWAYNRTTWHISQTSLAMEWFMSEQTMQTNLRRDLRENINTLATQILLATDTGRICTLHPWQAVAPAPISRLICHLFPINCSRTMSESLRQGVHAFAVAEQNLLRNDAIRNGRPSASSSSLEWAVFETDWASHFALMADAVAAESECGRASPALLPRRNTVEARLNRVEEWFRGLQRTRMYRKNLDLRLQNRLHEPESQPLGSLLQSSLPCSSSSPATDRLSAMRDLRLMRDWSSEVFDHLTTTLRHLDMTVDISLEENIAMNVAVLSERGSVG